MEQPTPLRTEPRRLPLGPILIGAAVVLALVILFRVLPVSEWLEAFSVYVQGLGALGWVLYAAVYAACARAGGAVSGRSAQPSEMVSRKPWPYG